MADIAMHPRDATMTSRPGLIRRRRKEAGLRLLRGTILWVIAILFLLPFVWMVSSSLKPDIDVFDVPVRWIPKEFRWHNYVDVWVGAHSMTHYFVNSGLVAIARIVGEVTLASLAGYAFGRLRFRGRNILFVAYLATSFVPFQLLLVPRFMFFRELGLYNSLWALILPSLSSVFGAFLLRQHFASAPAELGEAARIDGANELKVFLSVYLPLARPIIAAYAILVFDASWNDFETPLVMLSDDSKYTVPLGLTQFSNVEGPLSAAKLMAASVSSVIPILIVFLIFQRQFLQSMARVGLR